MKKTSRSALLAAVSTLVIAPAAFAQTPAATRPTANQDAATTVGEVVVTARQRTELLQAVPMAVSAYSQENLLAQGIATGSDLVNAVPNLTYNANNSSYTIRGIGYGIVATSADQGIAIHLNDAPLVVTPLNTSEFYDVERVEVLRGPQGTLYGRNATGGVVNTITAKPKDTPSAMFMAGYGNFNSVSLEGRVNAPVNGALVVRFAGEYIKRDGYLKNVQTGNNIDGKDFWSTRLTVAYNPTAKLHSTLMWQHFDEDDSFETYGSNIKVLCKPDPGLTSVGGVSVNSALAQNYLSRGCAATTVYDKSAYVGQPNPFGTIYALNSLFGQLVPGFTYAPGSPLDLRKIALPYDPINQTKQNIIQLNNVFDLSSSLSLKSLTTYSQDNTFQVTTDQQVAFFNPGAPNISSSGTYNDPAFGGASIMGPDRFTTYDDTLQWSQEFRLQSDNAGPFNFNLGVNYIYLNRDHLLSVNNPPQDAVSQLIGIPTDFSIYPNGQGHNYYYGRTPYKLTSEAIFGELYWQMADDLRLTLGGRYTDDKKTQYDYAVKLFTGPPAGNPFVGQRSVEFKKPTGRVVLDWSPKTDFTDHTLIYGSYSRGYKAGGFNGASVAGAGGTLSYDPEFINAYEIGTKNELLDKTLTLDLTGYYYDYTGYQIGQVVNFNTSVVNVDASVKGIEFESVYQPVSAIRLNLNIGYTDTAISGGSSINVLNRNQNNPNIIVLTGLSTHCAAPASALAPLISMINAGTAPANSLLAICPGSAGQGVVGGGLSPTVKAVVDGITAQSSGGIPVLLKDKKLPNSPDWTISAGAQYNMDLTGGWSAKLRGDVYHQTSSFATIYNDPTDRYKGYTNVNVSLMFDKPAQGLRVQLYAKNLFDNDGITAIQTTADASGQERFISVNDPRTFGIKLTKSWQ